MYLLSEKHWKPLFKLENNMYCSKCGNNVVTCNCPDIEERLKQVANSSNAGPCGVINLQRRKERQEAEDKKKEEN